MFTAVSLSAPPRPRATEIAIAGGCEDTPMKYENGAMFDTPDSDWVPTHAMGLGTINDVASLYAASGDSPVGSITIVSVYRIAG